MHPKLQETTVIYLVGFMGCGKSTVGRMLAEHLGWAFADLDEEIERRSGMPIPQIFERRGESAFRQLEHEAWLEQWMLAQQGQTRVVALGGGAFVDPRNRDQFQKGGLSIWLDCSLARLWERVSTAPHRPLARDRQQFERLYQERLPHYRQADFTVPADTDQPGEILDSILKLPLFPAAHC